MRRRRTKQFTGTESCLLRAIMILFILGVLGFAVATAFILIARAWVENS